MPILGIYAVHYRLPDGDPTTATVRACCPMRAAIIVADEENLGNLTEIECSVELLVADEQQNQPEERFARE